MIEAAPYRFVVRVPLEMLPPAMEPQCIQHRQSDAHAPEQQERDEAEEPDGLVPEPATHREHYHWYGADKSMFPSLVA